MTLSETGLNTLQTGRKTGTTTHQKERAGGVNYLDFNHYECQIYNLRSICQKQRIPDVQRYQGCGAGYGLLELTVVLIYNFVRTIKPYFQKIILFFTQ